MIVILIASTVWFVARTTVYKIMIFGGMQQMTVVKSQEVIMKAYFISICLNIDDCIANRIHVYYHTNLQKCAQETFLNIPLSLETINQGHQLERDVLNHVFMKQEDGDQVTATRKTVIGEQNVFPVQVHESFFFYHQIVLQYFK